VIEEAFDPGEKVDGAGASRGCPRAGPRERMRLDERRDLGRDAARAGGGEA
jgi:hypothetical protein